MIDSAIHGLAETERKTNKQTYWDGIYFSAANEMDPPVLEEIIEGQGEVGA